MEEINKELFLLINSLSLQNNILDNVILFLGEFTPYLFILLEIVVYFAFKYKNEAILAFNSMLLALVFSKLISLFYVHNRPFVDNIGHTLSTHAPDSSFPSDHTTFIFAILISLFFYEKTKKIAYYFTFIAIIGSFARVYEGIHYPFDIIAGIFIAIIASFIIYLLKDKFAKINNFIARIL